MISNHTATPIEVIEMRRVLDESQRAIREKLAELRRVARACVEQDKAHSTAPKRERAV